MKLPSHFSVIPCSGKVPLVKWQDFTSRAVTAQEQATWDKQYPNGDRGIICGPISRLFVLDVDGEGDPLGLVWERMSNFPTRKLLLCSTPTLREIRVPTLVVCGAEDAITPPADAEAIRKGVAGSRLEIVPAAGHLSNVEAPDAFGRLLAGFLAEL